MKLVCFHKWVEKPVYNHGGEFSHLDIRCPKCKCGSSNGKIA